MKKSLEVKAIEAASEKAVASIEKATEKAVHAIEKAAGSSAGSGAPAPGKTDKHRAKAAEKAFNEMPDHHKETAEGTFRREAFTPAPGRE